VSDGLINLSDEKNLARIKIARSLALNSPDPSTKVGAILYASYGVSVAYGWNSFPANSVVGKEYYDDRALKYDRVIHAEMRCLLQAGREAKGGVLYTTMVPCKDCAKHIAEAGVARVYYPSSCLKSDFVKRSAESVHTAMIVLAESQVEVIGVDE
jgi:deoxycytidylate deaminase